VEEELIPDQLFVNGKKQMVMERRPACREAFFQAYSKVAIGFSAVPG